MRNRRSKDNGYDGKMARAKALSRRSVLKGAAAAVGVAAASSVSGFPTIWAQDIKDIKLRSIGGAWSHFGLLENMANEALDFSVKLTAVSLPDIQTRALTQTNSSDLFEAHIIQMPFIWFSGKFRAWDTTKLPNWGKVVDHYKASGKIWPDAWYGQGKNPSTMVTTSGEFATDFTTADSTQWATYHAALHNADTVGIRPDLIGRPIDSWKELINPEINGKAALVSFPGVGLMDAAMAFEAAGMWTYSDKGNMSRDDIDFSIDNLVKLKKDGHWRALWSSFNQSVQLMSSGEVVIQSMWSPAVTAVRSQGIPCIYRDLQEGYRSWTDGHVLAKHVDGKKLGAAYDYATWYHSGPVGAMFARQGYYVVTPENTKKVLPAAEWDFWFEGKAATIDIYDPFGNLLEKPGTIRDGGSYKNRMGRVAVWDTLMDENEYLTDRWNEFVSA